MAWDHDRHRIAVISHAHRSKPLRPADGTGDIGIGSGFTVRDGDQGVPTGKLKIGTAQIKLEIECAPAPGEILFEFANVGRHCGRRFSKLNRSSFGAEVPRVGTDSLLSRQTGVEFESYQTAR